MIAQSDPRAQALTEPVPGLHATELVRPPRRRTGPRNPAENGNLRSDVDDADARAMPFVEIFDPGLPAKWVDRRSLLASYGLGRRHRKKQSPGAVSCLRFALGIVYALAANVRQAARTTREGSTRVMAGGRCGVDSLEPFANRYPTPGYVRMTPLAFGEQSFRRRLATWARRVCLSSA
jgi:hypothetical protein